MVDSISRFSGLKSASRSSNETLRSSFKSISSGKVVSGAGGSEGDVKVAPVSQQHVTRLSKTIQGLNDAVSFATRALDSLDRVAKGLGENEQVKSSDDSLSSDIDRLRKDIGSTIDSLQNGISTAEVIRENFTAAGSKLKDIDRANAQTARVVSEISERADEALSAHRSLQSDRVAALLSDN